MYTYDIEGQDTVLANRTYDIAAYSRSKLRHHIRFCVFIRYLRWEDCLPIVGYDIIYDIVGFSTMSYTTSYVFVRTLRYPRTTSDATSLYYNIEFFKEYDRTKSYAIRFNIQYGLPDAMGAAGAAAGRTGHVLAPLTAPAS